MTDNITMRDYDGNPVVIRADDISSVFWQYLKVAFGTDGTGTVVDAANPLPVTNAALVFDPLSDIPVTLDFAHHEIHDGSAFTASYTKDFSNGEVVDILMVTPDSTAHAHFTWAIDFELEGHMAIYEAVTATQAANPIVAYNRNRVGSPTAATVVLTFAPTAVTEGTTVIREAHAGSGKLISGSRADSQEFVLKPNTKYLIRVTNVAAATSYISVRLDWYEHT